MLITRELNMRIFKYIITIVTFVFSIDIGLGMKSFSPRIPDNWIRTTGLLNFGSIKQPEKGAVSHASTGAVSFEGNSAEKKINYICNLNFVSCAIDGPWSGNLPHNARSCLASKNDEPKSSHPRLDSEPAFLEYLTSSKDPVTDGIQTGSPLDIMMQDNPDKTFTLVFIKNSDYGPCVSGTRPGIPCNTYLQKFCNKFKCKIVVQWPNNGKCEYTPI